MIKEVAAILYSLTMVQKPRRNRYAPMTIIILVFNEFVKCFFEAFPKTSFFVTIHTLTVQKQHKKTGFSRSIACGKGYLSQKFPERCRNFRCRDGSELPFR